MKRVKIITSIILSVLLLISTTIIAFAEVTVEYGDFVLAWIDNDTAFKIYEYSGNDAVVDTPNNCFGYPITEIDENVFIQNTKLTKININLPISKIGKNAFLNCSNLSSVMLNDSLQSIGENAFYGCSSLKEIIIPESVKNIESYAFTNQYGLVISCYKDSCAHKYAVSNNIKFKLLDDPQPTTEPVTEVPTEPTTEPVTETVTPTEPVKTTYIVGDGNDNGHVDISDATVVQLLLANLMVDDGYVSQRAFFIEEGKSITNATYLQMYLAKLTTPYDNIIGTTKEYKK